MAVVSKNQAEQTPNPGIRVVEARIEDSANGKTCHQCRQKRADLVGSCVTKKRDKACPIKYCPKCLLNRYGEKPEEVALKNDWMCPKCRGNCNCSNCMKKRGQKPTGILVHTAKATGFSSVSELLKTSGSEKYFYQKKVKPECVVIVSPLNLGQENSTEEKHVTIKKSKKSKREELKDINNGSSVENDAVKKGSTKRIKISDAVQETQVIKKVLEVGKIKKTDAKGTRENNIAAKIKKTKPALKKKEEYQFEVKPPQGTSSITVSGIDLPPEDAGNAFQFLEFCSAFRKALDLRKGQAECVMRELLSGRSRRRQQYSTLTQMIIQLLTVILEDRGETSVCMTATDGSWFTAIGECLSESEVQLDYFPPEIFKKGISAYEKLDSSKRLKLLSFLCDEALGTSVLRSCIDSQNLESIERKKEVKEKMNAAKDKEKQLKQKLQDELAKAAAAKKGIPLLISERDAIVKRINAETKEAHSEIKNVIDMLSKESQGYDDAVRTNPVELDDDGLVFWRLKSYNEEPNILLQDLGSRSEVCPHEKWFAFSSEQKAEIDKYISFVRFKTLCFACRFRKSPVAPDVSAALAAREKVQQFKSAAITGNLDFINKVAKQFDEGKDLTKTFESIKDANKRGALHFAAREGQTDICRYLLEEPKLDFNTNEEAEDTPLVHVARQGHIGTAKYLLEHGDELNIASELGATALHNAAGIGLRCSY